MWAAVRGGPGRLGLEGLEFLNSGSRVCDFTLPQLAGARCRYMVARMGYHLEVKGEKHTLGHLGLLQTHGNFPKTQVLDSSQHRPGRRELRPRPQGPRRGRAWGTGPALRSLASGWQFWLWPSPYPPPGLASTPLEGSEKQGGVHRVSGPRDAQRGSPKIITMCATLGLVMSLVQAPGAQGSSPFKCKGGTEHRRSTAPNCLVDQDTHTGERDLS